MQLSGVCILTDDAPGLAAFYELVFREAPVAEGNHYGFNGAQLAVYDPGGVRVVPDKNMSLMYYVPDLMREYERLLRELPQINITSPPERRPWGAFSFWFTDPDGNTVSFIEKKDETL
ncbi:MAG: VOC family protein [Clostridiales bacterium]|nr:VOC family protein [Clostridiales bacterium]